MGEATATLDGITSTSTTDSAADINAALGVTVDAPAAAAEPDEGANEDVVDTPPAAGDPPADQAAPHKRSFAGRISQLTQERKAERARADALAAELEAIRRTIPAEKPAPKESDFSDYSSLEDAKSRHIFEQGYREQRIREQQAGAAARAALEQASIEASYNERLETVKKSVPDFEATVNRQDIVVTPEMRVSIFESPVGPQLAYFFGKHPEEAARISELRGSAALREIGKLEARLEVVDNGPTPSAYTPAPTPPKPLGGGATTASKLPLDHPDVTFKEYEQRRAAGER